MSGVAGRSGRKKFVPTPDHRDLVTLLATRGIPQEYIRRLIRNPQTGRPVSIKTLERAFATEIKTAKVEFACQIARFIRLDPRAKISQRQADKRRTVARHIGHLCRQDAPGLDRTQPPPPRP